MSFLNLGSFFGHCDGANKKNKIMPSKKKEEEYIYKYLHSKNTFIIEMIGIYFSLVLILVSGHVDIVDPGVGQVNHARIVDAAFVQQILAPQQHLYEYGQLGVGLEIFKFQN